MRLEKRSQRFLDAQGNFAGRRISQVSHVLHLKSEEHLCVLQLRPCAFGAATFHLPYGQGQHVCTTCGQHVKVDCDRCRSCLKSLKDFTQFHNVAAMLPCWHAAMLPYAAMNFSQDASQKDVTIKVEKPDEQHEVGKTWEDMRILGNCIGIMYTNDY